MSQPEESTLSDEQLQDVSGGLSERFQKERDQTLEADETELPDEQLKGVAGGLSERFKDEHNQTLDSNLTDSFDDARQHNLDSH